MSDLLLLVIYTHHFYTLCFNFLLGRGRVGECFYVHVLKSIVCIMTIFLSSEIQISKASNSVLYSWMFRFISSLENRQME